MVLNGWGKRKNASTAFLAFAELRKLMPKLRLSAVGYDFGLGERAQRWCASRGISEGIDFLGALTHNDVISQLKRSDLLLHPALEEAHPMAVCEAMALGLPVVAGQSAGGIPWLLGNEGADGLADVADVGSIVRTTSRVLKDRNVQRKLSSACRSRIRALCDPESVASIFEEIYHQAVAEK
jgi:glycosyltransferase involved in cell wall biosynthesis